MSSSQKKSVILILDVQSALVRGSLIYSEPRSLPRIIYITETQFPYEPQRGTQYHLDHILSALDAVIHHCLRYVHSDAIHAGIPKKIDHVHYVLSSPWIISRAHVVHSTFTQETVIAASQVSSIMASQRAEILSDTDNSFEIIEEKIFDIHLNGYRTDTWHSKQARSLRISYALSIAGSRTIRQFRDACAHAVDHSAISFHSGLILQHIATRYLLNDAHTYTLIHVHGELTDLVEVHNDTCTAFGSFPMGSNTIVAHIGDRLSLSRTMADSILTLSEQGNLEAEHTREAHTAIHAVQHEWSLELETIRAKAHTKGHTTHNTKIVLSAHAHEAFFTHALASTPGHGSIAILAIEDIQKFIHIDTAHTQSRMTALYALAIHRLQ